MTAANRLYLFDIDGTLINSGGAGSSAMRAAFAALWRVEDGFKGVEFAGRTDRAILRDGLIACGLHDGSFTDQLRRFKRAYIRRLGGSLRAARGTLLPGVTATLEQLSRDDRATLGLGTGNFRLGALAKLRHYGIDGYFRLGGFGDGSEDRAVLIGKAIRAGKRVAGRRATVFVIGDTVHDISAARANDAVAIGVATGTTSEAALAQAGADVVLSSLESATKHLLPSLS
jgi:phosphoglycolate phosphatase-like HAD superfamily hydrolase